MTNPSLTLGGGNWAVEEDFVLGWKINEESKKYIPREMTATRASDAFALDSLGVIRRFPWNLYQFSEQLDNAAWLKTNVSVVANAAASPRGDLSADLVIPTTTAGEHNVVGSGTPTSPILTAETVTVYAKAAGYNFLAIRTNVSSSWTASFFNLSTGTVSSASGLFTSSTIESVGNGWYRCRVTYSNRTANGVQIIPASTNGVVSFTGDGVSGVYMWGAQYVESSDPLVYLRTTNRQDVLRVDYSSGQPALLLEQQRTNLVLQSQSFGSASWTKGTGVTVVDNNATSPDNNLNASTVTFLSGGANEFVRQSRAFASGTVYTISVYARLISGNSSMSFDIENAISQSFTITNTWQRYTWTVTPASAYTWFDIQMGGSSVIQLYGAQIEQAGSVTTYIPTTTATATRSADLLSMSNISPLIGQTEGTLYIETMYQQVTTSGAVIFRADDGTENNRIVIFSAANSGNLIINISRAGSGVDIITYSNFLSLTNGGRAKIAIAYKDGDFVLAVNGSIVGTSNNSGAIPTLSAVRLNSNTAGALTGNTAVKEAQIIPVKLTNEQLITKTTL